MGNTSTSLSASGERGIGKYKNSNRGTKVTIAEAKQLLSVIQPRFADDYYYWIMTGLCLKTISEQLLPEWDTWSQLSPKYKPGECAYKWAGFKGLGPSPQFLGDLAAR
jgi:hypothetical protein